MAAATALSSGPVATDAASRPEPSAAAVLLSSGAATVGCDPIAAARARGRTVSDRQHEHNGYGRHERKQGHEDDQRVRPELAAELELGVCDV